MMDNLTDQQTTKYTLLIMNFSFSGNEEKQ